MARVDAGIDTTVEVDCDGCGTRNRTRLEAEPARSPVSLRAILFWQVVVAGPVWRRRRRQYIEE